MSMFEITSSSSNNGAFTTVQEKISSMNVSSISTKVQQSPMIENGYMAICQAAWIANGKVASTFGTAAPTTSKSEEIHILVQDAESAATSKAMAIIQAMRSSPSASGDLPFTIDATSFEPVQRPTYQGKHNPKKAISEKQKDLIISIANKQSRSVSEVAHSVCGKQINECSSADANEIIQYLGK